MVQASQGSNVSFCMGGKGENTRIQCTVFFMLESSYFFRINNRKPHWIKS